jgi:hypothetical protein
LIAYRLLSGSLAVLIVSPDRLIRLVLAGHRCERGSGWTDIGAPPTDETKSDQRYQTERFFEHRNPQRPGEQLSGDLESWQEKDNNDLILFLIGFEAYRASG